MRILFFKAYNPGYSYQRDGKTVHVAAFSDKRVKLGGAKPHRNESQGELFPIPEPVAPKKTAPADLPKFDHKNQAPLLAPETVAQKELKKYYVTVRREEGDGVKTGWLSGPHDTHAKALALVEEARRLANQLDPRTDFDAFGTASITAEEGKHPNGVLNDEMAKRLRPVARDELTVEKPRRVQRSHGKIIDREIVIVVNLPSRLIGSSVLWGREVIDADLLSVNVIGPFQNSKAPLENATVWRVVGKKGYVSSPMTKEAAITAAKDRIMSGLRSGRQNQ